MGNHHQFVALDPVGGTWELSPENPYYFEIVPQSLCSEEAVFRFNLKEGSRLQLKCTVCGIQHYRLRIYVQLEKNAVAEIGIRSLSLSDEKFSCYVEQQHLGDNSRSKVDIKSAGDDEGFVHFEGMMIVPCEIKNVVSEQRCEGLLLSSKAQIEMSPGMKIDSKEVECSHGVAISGIPLEVLLYAASRGLSKEFFQEIYIKGFLLDPFDC